RRAAADALHGQCGHDRLGGAGTLSQGAIRSPGFRGEAPLAARSRGGAGAGRGSEGMRADNPQLGPKLGPKLGVIGAGAWGTALAQMLASDGNAVLLWAREPELVDEINASRRNGLYLPSAELAPSIRATGD